MNIKTQLGNLAWVTNKLKDSVEAAEIVATSTDPATREKAAFDAATKIAEAVGIGIPLWFIDKAITKTGLDRVFDSLKKNQSFERYLKEQIATKNLRDLGIGTIADWGLKELRDWISENQFLDPLFRSIDSLTNRSFNSARNFSLDRDPLVLDLDGDGLELTAASSNLLFDHDADGIQTGTGWAGSDDGFLVRNLNGNGLIDSGRELFGEDTLKQNGQLARQGFDALADLDSNADGHVTNGDAAWSELQVWRDLNQDGTSQSHELTSLDALNITRIGVNGSNTGPQAGQTIQNNRVALSTTFTRDGADHTIGAIDLDANPFFSDIPAEQLDEAGNAVALTEAALALPQMNGSGMVRNLRAAMSQSGAAADELEAALTTFAAAPTRDQQLALLDTLITEWAQTSSYWSELEGYLGGTATVNPPVGMSKAECRNMVAVLEAFNGSRCFAGRQALHHACVASRLTNLPIANSSTKALAPWPISIRVRSANSRESIPSIASI